ncbi:MAG TPA: hypothetical protein VJU15_05850 [Gemmatimonadales bacterium]|nr:hypothetical protein [Gemmatimonadales bacterium]
MSSQSVNRTSCILGATLLLLTVVSQPAVAQCSAANNSGENLYVSDPVLGCKRFPLSGGLPTTKPRIRRGVKTHFLLVRGFINSYKDDLRPSLGSVSNQVSGVAGDGIPFLSWDLTLGESVTLGDMRIDAGPAGLYLDEITLRIAVDRRGEITAIQQTPVPGLWGSVVNVTVTGRDIGNATLEIASHTVSGITSGNTSLTFTTRASSTVAAQTSADMVIWDKANSKSLGYYRFPGKAYSGQLAYATMSATGSCTSVPNLGAPSLGAPTSGAVIGGFASATDPVNASVSLSWQKVAAPLQSYVLHLETFIAATTSTALTGGKTGTTTTLSPLSTTEQTVIMPTSQASLSNVTQPRSLTRHRTYKWKVRATNCGQSAAWSPLSTFTVN